jgi:two-component system NarL family sensor kinase
MANEQVSASAPSRVTTALQGVVWIVAALEAALVGFSPLLFPGIVATTPAEDLVEFVTFLVSIAVVVLVFATAGLLISRQQPRNAVGWLLLGGGPALGGVFLGYLVGTVLIETDPALGGWFVLVGGILFGPALYLVGPGLVSLFPDGRPLPGWWTAAFWISAAAIAAGAAVTAISPGPLEESIAVANPLGIAGLPSGVRDVANVLTGATLAAGTLIAVASLVVRYRRSASDTRHQLKWLVFVGVLLTFVLPLALVVGDTWTAIIALLTLGLVPIAVVIAVLRYRLYEIDTLINRTFVYVPLVGITAGLYTGSVALLQRIFTAVTGDTSDAAAVISALALAAVFTPIRNAIQSAVDRRFKPNKPEPDRWDDPAFRSAVEAIVKDVTDRGLTGASSRPAPRPRGSR